jgi:ligand-binding sensor domain-containing protein
MRSLPYILMFLLMLGLSVSARNQDAKSLESLNEPVLKVKAIYVDSEGVKWFGTDRGLCRYRDLTWTYYTDADYLVGNQVNALTFEESDFGRTLWVATSEGVSEVLFDVDGIKGATSYTEDEGLLNKEVSDVAIDSRGGKFFASADGITWFHEGTMEHLMFQDYYASMVNKPVRQLELYGDTLYLAQDGGIGRLVSGVDGITGASRWTSEYGITPYSENIRSIKVKGIEKQWFATDVGVETHTGYFAKDNWDLYSTEDGLIHNDVISIAEDPNGGLWFGTHGGVSHLLDGVWTSYTTAEGLLNDTVYATGFDLDGSVWFGTGSGACRLKDGIFQDYITSQPEQSIPELNLQVFYDPSTGSIAINYRLPSSTPVSARLYDIRGVLLAQWNELPGGPAENQVRLDFPTHSVQGPRQGLYVLQLIQGPTTSSKKLLITN